MFEDHVHALRAPGGVARSKIRYDNLEAAVARLPGLSRAGVEADRWIAFKPHFGTGSFSCPPDTEGAPEKGGAEGRIGNFRHNHFLPVLEVADRAVKDRMAYRGLLAELLMAECDDRARRRSERRTKAAGFPREKALRAFDFDARPSIGLATVHALADCEWIKKSQSLRLIGGSGTGHRCGRFQPRRALAALHRTRPCRAVSARGDGPAASGSGRHRDRLAAEIER
ncbi:IstB-like ATP-binding domain-containing protein OS=Streptomyces griseomycini OX=66895 GN=FHS37_003367 PE=4 SV=1 [Streptomyces griseomycini]|uniref:IstB-like ATP-binding domain-containing protein n=1 Tax=Streptomyces griseomycini TaxID=66895 RepID=A0A7W7LZQ8_9ACTN|nr:hypothetical protein [Streptomyces griseomycini]GGR35431.1 hypothetical protein GCM10015536_46380 [Streptomyces griseomycini]